MGGEASPELKGAAKDEGYKLRVSLPIPCRSELFPRCHAELVLHCYFESILYCSELFYIVILSRRRRISRVLIIVSSHAPLLYCLSHVYLIVSRGLSGSGGCGDLHNNFHFASHKCVNHLRYSPKYH